MTPIAPKLPPAISGAGLWTSRRVAKGRPIPMVRIDKELPDTQIDALKIDVEGADT
jgi:hypothetical protein